MAVDRNLIESESPDVVIVATGGRPYRPDIECEGVEAFHADDVLPSEKSIGATVVIVDACGDWVAPGLSEKYARLGHKVFLCVCGVAPATEVPRAVTHTVLAALIDLEAIVYPMMQIVGAGPNEVVLVNTVFGQPKFISGVDSLIFASGHEPDRTLELALHGASCDVRLIGDCLAPRTAEEAVLEGLRVGMDV